MAGKQDLGADLAMVRCAVYAMQVETPYGKRTITTETTARDELFLRELGITLVH